MVATQGQRIKGYGIKWHPGLRKGVVMLDVVGDPRPDANIQVNSAEELAALAAVLNKSPVYFHRDGTISTDRIPS